uniref:DoxX family protein n=3 Tax=Ditylum brightwellii TaxID=49249 RepID=A0A6S8ZWK9_9STRA|mmetsp:Transcript_32412/g.43240  ORF Transcript_32412/g.43240 Transcript_32412/m.43240 type:complete len:242 (-) Transcript_32412:375-1100(-)
MKSLSLISCLIALTAANNAVSAFAPTTPPSKSFLIAPSAATNKEILTKKSSHAFFMSSGDEVETKKETTWDRITGPKLFKTVTNWNGIHSVPLVPLRIFTGLLMVHHGSEGGFGPANFGTPEFQGFMDYIMTPYFGFLPGSLEFWAAVHDYAEFFGGILFTIGFLTRPAALSLLITMSGAVYFHLSSTGLQGFPFGHVSNYSYDFEEPLLYALIFLMFWFNGAGPLSVDSVIYSQISQEEE